MSQQRAPLTQVGGQQLSRELPLGRQESAAASHNAGTLFLCEAVEASQDALAQHGFRLKIQ